MQRAKDSGEFVVPKDFKFTADMVLDYRRVMTTITKNDPRFADYTQADIDALVGKAVVEFVKVFEVKTEF
jgi:hypothetical protein